MTILKEQKSVETFTKKGLTAEDLNSYFKEIEFATLSGKDIILNGFIPRAP